MKIKIKVNVIYEFEEEVDLTERNEIQEFAEDRWESLVNVGLEDEYYQEAEVEWREV